MEIKFEDLKYANESIQTTDIKGKEYAEVNQRVKAFRMVYPTGFILTRLVSDENGVCIFRAMVYDDDKLLATGTAYEKENSSFINKTSYIENCETSAVGRALGMCGFGIDVSVASAEEVQNAINNQETIETEEQARALKLTFGKYNGETIGTIYEEGDIKYLEWLFDKSSDLNIKKAVSILTGLVEKTTEESIKEINEMPIIESQKQQIKDKCSTEEIKEMLIKLNKSKLSELTYAEADELIKGGK